jgi:Holliday junction resolvase
MKERGFHTERVAASGRRKYSVCDAVLFTKKESFLVEVKSTREVVYRMTGLHGIIEKANEFKIIPLLAVYFKSSHSSKGEGKWVLKRLNVNILEVRKDDRSDDI